MSQREDHEPRMTGARLNPAAEAWLPPTNLELDLVDSRVSGLNPFTAPIFVPAPVSSAELWRWAIQKLDFFQRGRALQRARDAQAKMFEDAHVYYLTSKPGGPGPGPGRKTTYHPQESATLSNKEMSRSGKKALNVESPSFTPLTLQQAAKKSTFSSQAASAAPFTPRGPSTNSE